MLAIKVLTIKAIIKAIIKALTIKDLIIKDLTTKALIIRVSTIRDPIKAGIREDSTKILEEWEDLTNPNPQFLLIKKTQYK